MAFFLFKQSGFFSSHSFYIPNKSIYTFNRSKKIIICLLLLVSIGKTFALTYYTRQSGNWTSPSTWSTVGCGNSTNTGTYPGPNDNVEICNNSTTVTLDANVSCNSIKLDQFATLALGGYNFSSNSTTFNSDQQTISGTGNGSNTLNLGGNSKLIYNSKILTTGYNVILGGNLDITNGAYVSIGNANLTIGGNLSVSVSAYVLATGSNSTIGGNLDLSNNAYVSIGSGNLAITGNYTNTSNTYNTKIDWSTGTVTIGGNINVGKNGMEPFTCTGTGWLFMNSSSKTITLSNDITVLRFRQSSSGFLKAVGNTFTISQVFDQNCGPAAPAGVTISIPANTTTCPTLNVTALTSFGNVCTSSTAGPYSFTITGISLTTANVTVAALPGFSYSTTSGGTYTSTLSFTQSGGAYSQVIYVLFNPSSAISYNGNIVVGGGGAPNVNVVAVGSGANSVVPTITSPTSSNVLSTSAILGGNITVAGCSSQGITERGIYYSTTPDFADGTGTKVSETGTFGIGAFTENVTGLSPSTTYYYKAFATNSSGTVYTSQGTFNNTPITYYTRQSGNWTSPTTWSTVGCSNATNTGTYPGPIDNVEICYGTTITLDANTSCNSLKLYQSTTLALGGYNFSSNSTTFNSDQQTISGTGNGSNTLTLGGNSTLTFNIAKINTTGYNVTIAGNPIVTNNAYFNIGAANLTIGGNLSVNTSAYVLATGSNSTIGGNLDLSNNAYVSIGSGNLAITGNYTNTSNTYNTKIDWSTGTVTIGGNINVGKNGMEPFTCTGTGWLFMNSSSKTITLSNDITILRFRQSSSGFLKAVGNTFTISQVFDQNCGPAAPAGVTISIPGNTIKNTNNTISLTSAVGTNSQTIYKNNPITNITYTTTGATGATVTGLPAGVTGNWASNIVTISGTPTELGSFSYTVTLTGGCSNPTATGTITVNNVPVVVSGANGITDGTGYTTLKGAFDAINAQTNQTDKNISVIITASTNETASAVLNGNASTPWTSLKIYPNTSGLSITGNIAGALIDLSGANNVTIDGRVNATGSAKSLVISNTKATNNQYSTIRFINDASNNTVQYCTIKGSEFRYSTPQSGVVFFATGTTTGNDNNTITNNDITNAGGNRPVNAIYSYGTAGKENNNITISNNNIYDCMQSDPTSNGIFLSANTTACSITGNNIYETTSIVPIAESTYTAINIDNTSGNGFTISNNNIGGSSALCTGTWTKTIDNNTSFQGIYLNVGTSTASEVQNNTIKGFNWSNSIGYAWYGIWLNGGSANIGTTTGNTIGATTGNGSISVTNSQSNDVYAISLVGSGNVSCQKNIIGSITTNNASSNRTNLYGIKNSCTGTVNISNNLIGSASTSNSLYAQSASTGVDQSVWGIYNSGTGSVTISNNTIANLTNGMTGSTSPGVVNGIISSAGTNTISSNIIHDLTNANSTTSSNNNASVGGIILTSTSLNTVSGNSIYNLSNTNSTFSGDVVGLYFTGSTGANTVSNNFICNLSATGASSSSANIYGIRAVSGATTYSNNIISLGGSAQSTLYGIYDTGAASQTCNLYFNTVYLSGNVASGSNKSYCLYSNSLSNTRNFRDNIFSNVRSTIGGVSLHYAASFNYNANTSLILGYNDYFVSGTGGVLAYYNGADKTLSDIVATSTGWEPTALSVNPNFTTPNGMTALSYRPLTGIIGTSIGTITQDYQNSTRTSPTIGAFEVNNVEVWKGTLQAKYATLRAAFNAINAGTHTGALEIRLSGNTVETGFATLNASGSGSSNYSSILIYPTVSGCSITINMTTTLFTLNGAKYVTLDGRVNQTGIADLTISNTENTSFSSRTVVFENGATDNTIKYCYIKGASTGGAGAVIWFDTITETGTTGNNNNTIDHCFITNSGSRPTNGIISQGNTAHPNTGNIISNNNIYDIMKSDDSSRAIYVGVGSTGFTITGNSIYETTTLTPTVSGKSYYLINIENALGNNFTITDNYIGGNAPMCAGSAFTVNTTQNQGLRGISVNVGTDTPSIIDNNLIKNFDYTSSSTTPWCGIYLTAGAVNVGTVNGNTIGETTGNGSITITNPTANATSYGIYNVSTSPVSVNKNNIGSITTTGSGTTSHGFIGIYKQNVAGDWSINSNVIGSTSTVKSIQASSATTSAAGQLMTGIQNNGSGTSTISNNTVANLYNAYIGTNIAARTRGIDISNGSGNIQSNIIRDISSTSAQVASDISASVIGIAISSSSAINQSIAGNTIFNLSNTNPSAKVDVDGILTYINSSNSCIIANNFIHSLSLSSSDNTCAINGISYNKGQSTISNNIVNLGTGITTGYSINGINNQCSGSDNNAVYFNTVYLTGNVSGTTSSTYALYERVNSVIRDYRNNILYNARTGGTTGAHYAVSLAGKSNLTIDYNDYFSAGVICSFAGTDKTTLTLLKTATTQDIHSYNINPTFTNAGSTTATDYKIGVNLVGVTGIGIANDYAANVRSTEYTAMGAWERAMTNYWKGTNSTDWATTTNWTLNVLPPTDGNLIFDATPVNNCVMGTDYSVRDITNSQSTYNLVANGHKLTVKGNLNLSNGAQLDASASGSTVEFAGSLVQSIPSAAFVGNNIYNLSMNNSNNVTFNGTLNLLNTITANSGKLDATTNSPTICYAGTSAQTIGSELLSDGAYNLTIDNATGVTVNTDFTVNNLLTINTGKLLTIPVSKKLNVIGSITNNAGAAGLVIKSSSSTENGSLIFHNAVENPVQATVEMYSKAAASTYNSSTGKYSDYKWQYFGIPVRSIPADPTFAGSYIRQYAETSINTPSWITLNNSSTLSSFYGYEITQVAPRTIYFQGDLENADLTKTLTYTTGANYPGYHILSNPYTAAIDVTQLNFTNMDKAVYLYNTGSSKDWQANSGSTDPSNNAGQYVAAPKNTSGILGIPAQIPSMQGFMVIAYADGGTLNIPYNSVAIKNTNFQRISSANRAPQQEKVCTVVDISGSRFKDKMWLISDPACTHKFDNGWDGLKIIGSTLAPQIYAIETDGNYQVNSVDNINNTYVGFQAGEDSEYTMTFTHQNFDSKYTTLYLTDLLTNKSIDISQSGSTYSFTSDAGSTLEKRFKITTSVDVHTQLDQTTSNPLALKVYNLNQTICVANNTPQSGELTIYDMAGKVVTKSQFSANNVTRIKTDIKGGYYLAKARTLTDSSIVKLFMP